MSNQCELIEPQYNEANKVLKSYWIGLVLSVILTLVAFALVEKKLCLEQCLYVSISALAIIQIIIQILCFFRLAANGDGRWSYVSLIFTFVVICIVVGGSLWIMYNLNYYMVH